MTDTPVATKDRVLVEVTIPASVDEVWRALREPDQIRRWFGWETDSLADEIEYIFVSHAAASDAEHVIRFDEWGGVSDRFELEARGAGTVLRVVRAGQPDQDWSNVYEEMTEGWISFVEQLRLALARHRARSGGRYISGGAMAEARRRCRGGGVARFAAWTTEPLQRQAAGEAWRVRSGTARPPAGRDGQDWGDGLLIVNDKPVNEEAPTAAGR